MKKFSSTNQFFLSSRVLNTINSLPTADRVAIASAIAGELILGCDASRELSPLQNLVFGMIRRYVERDTELCTDRALMRV